MISASVPVLTQRAPGIAFFITLGLWVVGERVLWLRDFRIGRQWRWRQDRGSYLWVLLGVGGGLVAGLGLASSGVARLPGPTMWLVAGLVTAWAGMGFRFWAVRTLGRFFTTRVAVANDQKVVTDGPYRYIRHPSYLGVIVLMVGFGLALSDGLSVLVMLVLPTAGLVPRITVEEAALRQGLGDTYARYAEGRARLLPGVW
jgi:protein-S-isoprenylcysteine O-methyltransferase Ste14